MVETGKNQAHVGVAICKVTLSLKWGGHVTPPLLFLLKISLIARIEFSTKRRIAIKVGITFLN
jgi:hypothetical protein